MAYKELCKMIKQDVNAIFNKYKNQSTAELIRAAINECLSPATVDELETMMVEALTITESRYVFIIRHNLQSYFSNNYWNFVVFRKDDSGVLTVEDEDYPVNPSVDKILSSIIELFPTNYTDVNILPIITPFKNVFNKIIALGHELYFVSETSEDFVESYNACVNCCNKSSTFIKYSKTLLNKKVCILETLEDPDS